MGCQGGSCGSEKKSSLANHPCFSPHGHGKTGRIHLPVAPGCNISCGYCVRKFDCANESRPGVTSRVINPEQALWRVEKALAGSMGPYLAVVGIAGPGEPLANPNTFRTLRLVKEKYPHMMLCVSSNGLLLTEKVEELIEIGISHITVTLNSLRPETGAAIYPYVYWKGEKLTGLAAAERLIEQQLKGIEKAAQAGLLVKVNTVVIPGINDEQIEEIAEKVKSLGAAVLNLMPLINQGIFAHLEPPTVTEMTQHRQKVATILPQIAHCRQCRADAIGLI
ncbi:radical SAM protein [Heliorestis convoluta]|uniref:FeMo cofactor biosynthesis protein NifB n=1 Tax=Heliorestis convoluta TaxID=356322 RepID=A0A5Q2N0M9_9FIRM|nr:radical SAM protein [Heliorestis convoluta]QGG48558.1 nitrogenase cofactor biosynthesis protein NifB [Heliorestis convoluta]